MQIPSPVSPRFEQVFKTLTLSLPVNSFCESWLKAKDLIGIACSSIECFTLYIIRLDLEILFDWQIGKNNRDKDKYFL